MILKEFDELPSFLKEIRKPPLRVYLTKEPSLNRYVALVGARSADFDSLEFTKKLTRCALSYGYGIVSGGALGVDMVAHEECLSLGGETIVVLGCGYNKAPPRLLELEKRGAILLSEFEPDKNPSRWKYRFRNRLISALSKKVVVVEAGEKSGALITARYALEQKRELWAYGGSGSERYAGCIELIKNGYAKEVKEPSDVFVACRSDDWLLRVKHWPATFDELLEVSNMQISELALRLIELEIKGRIKFFSGRFNLV
ncbi:MAG: DNA-protecting protein DprA [Aquificaceae bacterium]|nr:DNA-protecting protein DprA [Aquificaceae bacterium]MDW8237274.1 DNA-processing protein DprA [Aquificaceae bacterium]